MPIALVVAILATGILLLLILRGSKNKVLLIFTLVVAAVSWLVVGVLWLTDQWSANFSFSLPDLKIPLFATIVSAVIIFAGRLLGKKTGMQTTAIVVGAGWLAFGMGWLVGEWSGILAIAMPSVLIMTVGLLALPPFVLPVRPLPWKGPTFVALVYTLLWLVGMWNDWLAMDIVSFWVYMQGLLLILRPAFPLDTVKRSTPLLVFTAYAALVLAIWRVFYGFELNTLNLLILTQGVLVLSCYTLPVTGKTVSWSLTLSWLYGMAYIAFLALGRIEATATNFAILLLGVAAFERFLPAGQDEIDWRINSVTILRATAVVLLILYVLVWLSGLILQQLDPNMFNLLIFAVGVGAILVPAFVKPSKNWLVFKAVLTYNLGTNYPYQAVTGRELVTRVEGRPFAQSLAGPGIVLSDADHAVVIHSGGRFNRVAPPGVSFTRAFETVKEIVDLRPQLRSMPPVVAKTRDGIEVTVVAFTPFRIATNGRELHLGGSFPYDPEGVRRAVNAQRIAQETDKKRNWDELIREAREQVMRDIIAKKMLDELCGYYPRVEVASEMRIGIRTRIQRMDCGLELIGGSVGNFRPPDEVIQQRIEHWKAHWENAITYYEAKAEAEERKMVENARAEAQRSLFLNVTDGLDPLASLDPADANKLMALSLLEAIEREGVTDADLAHQIGPSVQAIYGLLGPTAPDDGDAEES